ncbi:MAG: hypothetical protein JWP87_4326 [Labilithrix sp.]|nr:hypothetical protein [Labilithrix sp.]
MKRKENREQEQEQESGREFFETRIVSGTHVSKFQSPFLFLFLVLL